MLIKQISVILDNVPGKVQEISQLLDAERINIRAITVASTDDISTVRLVVDDPAKALNVLKSSDYSVKEADVIAVEVPDHPGGLQAILKPLKEANINVPYMYTHLGRAENGNAIVIVGVNRTQEALQVLKANWVSIHGKGVNSL